MQEKDKRITESIQRWTDKEETVQKEITDDVKETAYRSMEANPETIEQTTKSLDKSIEKYLPENTDELSLSKVKAKEKSSENRLEAKVSKTLSINDPAVLSEIEDDEKVFVKRLNLYRMAGHNLTTKKEQDISDRWATSLVESRIRVLYNDKRKSNTDSPEMRAVKEQLEMIDSLLNSEGTTENCEALQKVYHSAIHTMQNYEKKKTPFSFEGRRRKSRVKKLRKTLQEESERIKGFLHRGIREAKPGEKVKDILSKTENYNKYGIDEQFVEINKNVQDLRYDSDYSQDPVLSNVITYMGEFVTLLNTEVKSTEYKGEHDLKWQSEMGQIFQETVVRDCEKYLKANDYGKLKTAKERNAYRAISKVKAFIDKYSFLRDTKEYGYGTLLAYGSALKEKSKTTVRFKDAFNDMIKMHDRKPKFDEKQFYGKDGGIEYEKFCRQMEALQIATFSMSNEWNNQYSDLQLSYENFVINHLDREFTKKLVSGRQEVYQKVYEEYKGYLTQQIPEELTDTKGNMLADKEAEKQFFARPGKKGLRFTGPTEMIRKAFENKTAQEKEEAEREQYLRLLVSTNKLMLGSNAMNNVISTIGRNGENLETAYIRDLTATMKKLAEEFAKVEDNDYSKVLPLLEEGQKYPVLQTFKELIENKDYTLLNNFLKTFNSNVEDLDTLGLFAECSLQNIDIEYDQILQFRTTVKKLIGQLKGVTNGNYSQVLASLEEEKVRYPALKPVISALKENKTDKTEEQIKVLEGLMEDPQNQPMFISDHLFELSGKFQKGSGWFNYEKENELVGERTKESLLAHIRVLKEAYPEEISFSIQETLLERYGA